MKKIVFMTLAVAIAASCVKENMPQTESNGQFFTFEASKEDMKPANAPKPQQAISKAVLVEGNKVEWHADDAICVFNDKGSEVGSVNDDSQRFVDEDWQTNWKFNAQGAGPKTTFKANSQSFTEGTNHLMVYPHDATYYGRIEDDGTMMIRFWLNRNQTATLGSFDRKYCASVAKATSLSSEPVTFKPVLSLLKFTVPQQLSGQITNIAVKSEGGYLGGDILCDYTGAEPVVSLFFDTYGKKGRYDTMYLNSTDGMAAGNYYLAVCPATMTGLEVTVTFKSGSTYTRVKKGNMNFNSGIIYDMGAIDTEVYSGKGITELPYVFSFYSAQGSGANPKYVTGPTIGGDGTNEKTLSMTDEATGVQFYAHEYGNSTYAANYINYWARDEGCDGFTGKMFNKPGLIGDGKQSYIQLMLPLNTKLPNTFRVSFAFDSESIDLIRDWKVQYSANATNWFDGGSFSLPKWKACIYHVDININSQITVADKLYLRWVPSGDVNIDGNQATGYNAQLYFWGGVVISETTNATTTKPSEAIYFEAFDKINGGVDYRMNGQSNGTEKLGKLAWAHGSLIDSWTEEQKNGLTGSHVVMRPGYVQIGRPNDYQGYDWATYGNNIGSLVTPKLQAGTLNVSFKAMILRDPILGRPSTAKLWKDEPVESMIYDTIIVNVKGDGTFEDGSTSKTISGVSHTDFVSYNLQINDATTETQIEFTSPRSADNTTWFLDEICVK